MTGADAPSTVATNLQALVDVLGGTVDFAEDGWVGFIAGELYVIANHVDVAGRLRIRVYLPIDKECLVNNWISQQPPPRSGLLQSSYIDEDKWRPRLVFERPTVHDWTNDPLFDDIDRYLTAWLNDTSIRCTSRNRPPYVIPDDPRDHAPASAWLLKGSEASFPSRGDLRDDRAAADVGIFTWDWTTAPQTQIGDLVLIYFITPRKAVHFVARAASNAFFSRDIAVNADGEVNNAQWWSQFTTPIEIEPIPVEVLRSAAGGYLPLRGRSGLYLRPEVISALPFRAVDPADQAALDRVVRTPVGIAELPDPADITHDVWRDLAAGALRLEADVCTYVVEPLLRDLLAETDLTWKREYPVGRRWADFVILNGDEPIHVIEVKKVIQKDPQGRWERSRDFAQLRWYSDQLGTSGTIIDSHRVLLVARGANKPAQEIVRRSATHVELQLLREHVLAT